MASPAVNLPPMHTRKQNKCWIPLLLACQSRLEWHEEDWVWMDCTWRCSKSRALPLQKSCAPCSTSSWLQEAMKHCISHKTARAKINKPWITADLLKLIRKRDRTYKKMKKSGWQELKDEVRKLRLWNTMQAPLNLLELPKWLLQWTRLHTSRQGDEEQTLDLHKAPVDVKWRSLPSQKIWSTA